jgi:hypothetical protein
MRGREAVALAVSLGCDYGEYLGIGFSRVAQILMQTDGDHCATERALLACDPVELSDSADIVRRLTGRLRYVALDRGGHLRRAELGDLVRWLSDRPYELWYAIRDAGLTGSVDDKVLAALPASAAFQVLLCSTAETAFKISGKNCERLVENLRREDVIPFMRAYPRAMLSNDWLRDNLSLSDLDEALGMKRERGTPDAPSSDWLTAAMRSNELMLVRSLRAYGRQPSTTWLAANVRYEMYAAMMDRFDEVTAEWLADHIDPDMLYSALKRGNKLRGLSAEWLLEKVPSQDVVSALINSGAINGMSRDTLRAYVPAKSLCRALTHGNKISGCDLAWLCAAIPKDTLYAAVLNSGIIDTLGSEWIVANLPPRHAYYALCRRDRIQSCSRSWLVSRFTGMVLYDSLVSAGLDTGFETLEEYAKAYGEDLHDVLHDRGELHAHALTDLARHLSTHDLVRAIYGRPGLTAQELAEVLHGNDLGDVLLDEDLCFGLDIPWLMEHGIYGRQLLDILEDNGGLEDLPADALVGLFRGATLLYALQITGAHVDLSDDELMAAFVGYPFQAVSAMRGFGRLSISPDAIARTFGASGRMCVMASSAFRTMDPDAFERYGVDKDLSIKEERLA